MEIISQSLINMLVNKCYNLYMGYLIVIKYSGIA